jgi:hypothetical protein
VAGAVGGDPGWGDLATGEGLFAVARQASAAAPELHVLVHNAPEQAAETALYPAWLPDDGPTGQLWEDRQRIRS